MYNVRVIFHKPELYQGLFLCHTYLIDVQTAYTITDLLCEEDEFQCPNDLFGRCMPLRYLCDNIDDCDDGFDEQNCSTSENEPSVHPYCLV